MGTISRICRVFAATALAVLSGCAVQSGTNSVSPVANGVTGNVHGGQQPVAFSTVQLYTVGTTADGSAATPLLTQTVTSDASGNFTLTGLYSCSGATLVYLTASGGQPGPGITNPNLAMMTALGPCSSLTPSTFIQINEVTTVAAVSALAPFMTGYSAVGSNSGDVSALTNAFTLASELVNTATGQAPGTNVPAGMAVPATLMNTLANVVAACVNSAGGISGDGSACGSLFALTTPSGGSHPTDTVKAMLYLAQNPALNTPGLFNLITPAAPFQPQLTGAPPAFGIRLMPATASGYVLQVGPSSLTFPNTVISSTSAAQTVLIENKGTGTVTVSGVTITGANAGDFAQTNNCTQPLATGASCTVQVTSTPSALGARSAYLAVASTSPDSPQYVSLAGTGVSSSSPASAARAKLSAYALNYSYIGVTKDITFSNIGSANLTISSITTATSNYTASSNCGSTVLPGNSCVISVTALAFAEDALVVTTNDTTSVQSAALSAGTFTNVTPSNVTFAPVVLGSSGTTPITVTDYSRLTTAYGTTYPTFSITGPNAADFAIPSPCNFVTPINNGTCSSILTFSPGAAGVRRASLNVGSDGSYIPLVGMGVATSGSSNASLSPSKLSFNDFDGPKTITLSNFSLSTMNIQSIATTSGFTQTNNCNGSLAAQSICTITVNSIQAVAGGSQGVLTVTDDVGTQTAQLLSNVDPFIQFGYEAVGQATAALSASTNSSSRMNVASFSGAGDFTGSYCNQVRSMCTVTLRFTPTTTGPLMQSIAFSLQDDYTPINRNFLAAGTGLPAGPELSPYLHGINFSLNFYYAAGSVGTSSTTGSNVINSGSTTLNLNNTAVITGANASEFSVTGTNCASLAVGAICNVFYTFTPAQVGLRTANLVMTDSISGQTFTIPVALIASPAPPAVAVSPASLTFPATPLYGVSAAQSVAVTTPFNDAVTAVLTSGQADFSLTKNSCATNESPCLITAVFHPSAGGPLAGSIAVTDPVTGFTQTVALSGSLPAAVAVLSATSLTFPQRATGTTSIPQTITLSNGGSPAFNISSIALSGTNAGEFILSNGCGASLAAGGACSIGVSFAPTTAGSKSASLVISGDSSAGLPITVPISGSAN
jgi:hypothetical protein